MIKCSLFSTRLVLIGMSFALASDLFASANGGAEFIVPAASAKAKKRSRDELKEEIGHKTKLAFEGTTALLQQLGKLQQRWAQQHKTAGEDMPAAALRQWLQESSQLHTTSGALCLEVAAMQTTYRSVIEKLIDNQKPFKKAGKVDLEKTLGILSSMHQQLVNSAHAVAQLEASVHASATATKQLQTMAKTLEQEQGKLHVLVVQGQQDTCLKAV